MRIGRMRVDGKSALLGMLVLLVAFIVPKVSELLISFVTSIRNKITGKV